MENIHDIQNSLKNGTSITLLSKEEIKYASTPIGNAIYKKAIENKTHTVKSPNDYLICDICGGKYTRAHKSDHKKTKIHKAHENMHRKFAKILLNI